MNVDFIFAVHCCELGEWLHGQATESYGSLKNYADVVGKHGEFHLQAGKIAAAINDRNYAEAEAMMGQGTKFTEASLLLTSALKSLWSEAKD